MGRIRHPRRSHRGGTHAARADQTKDHFPLHKCHERLRGDGDLLARDSALLPSHERAAGTDDGLHPRRCAAGLLARGAARLSRRALRRMPHRARPLQQSRHDRRADLPGTCHVQLRRHVRRGTARPAERSIGAQRILPPGMPPAARGGVPPPRLYGCGGAPSHTRDGGRGRGTDRTDRGRPCTRRDHRALSAH